MQARLKEVGFGIKLEDKLLQGKMWGSLMLMWMETSLVLIKWALQFFVGIDHLQFYFVIQCAFDANFYEKCLSWHMYRKFTRYYDQYGNCLLDF
jgi:hypothetical protein